MRREQLRTQYREIALRFLAGGGEEDLYEVSMLGRRCIEENIGPEEVIQAHSGVLSEVMENQDADYRREAHRKLSTLLLEAIMAYGETHRRVRDLLQELRERYAELDEAKTELEKSQDELRRRTAQLVQKEKIRALGELAAGVAHEINQPLNAIKLICEDIFRDARRDRVEKRQLEEGLAEVIEEVRKMAEIVDHMRIFTRRTEGARIERFAARAPIDGVLRLLGQQLKINGIEVSTRFDGEIHVEADPVRLEQVFMNLITNARDAVKGNDAERGKRIEIGARLEERGGGERCVVYEVVDNGHGIPESAREKIFEPFFSEKKPGEGTGLGLSVSKQIVGEHRGTIEVDSTEGEGTSVRVCLPLG